MPTSHPRYQITDTGRVRTLLDLAAAAWPDEAENRKALLLRLAEQGANHLPERSDSDAFATTLREQAGRWVAVREDTLLTASSSAAGVVAWLRERGERADQIYRVPHDADDLVGEHGAVG